MPRICGRTRISHLAITGQSVMTSNMSSFDLESLIFGMMSGVVAQGTKKIEMGYRQYNQFNVVKAVVKSLLLPYISYAVFCLKKRTMLTFAHTPQSVLRTPPTTRPGPSSRRR